MVEAAAIRDISDASVYQGGLHSFLQHYLAEESLN